MNQFTHYAVVRASDQALLGVGQTSTEAITEASHYMPTNEAARLQSGEESPEFLVVAVTDKEAIELDQDSDRADCFLTVLTRAHGY